MSWRHEKTAKGKATKISYTPRTGAKAKCDTPSTWGSREAAAASRLDGVAVVLSNLGDITLAGIDLDTCRDPHTCAVEPWAQEVVDRFSTYTEVSPSRTGLKLFFTIANADMPPIKTLSAEGGHSPNGRKFTNGYGGEHPPAIEVYTSGRFFTVTNELAGTTDELRCVSFADIEWLFREAVPKFTGKGKSGNGHDTSRSGAAFRAGAILRDDGASYEEMREALLEHEDPDIAEWARTKGLANNERELKRIYGKTSDKTPTLTEDALALIFAARRADDMRFIAAWSKWLSWARERIGSPTTRLPAFDEARAICRETAVELR